MYHAVGITHHTIHAVDEEGYDMIGCHWDECHAFLEKARVDENSKVVLHCVSGINRSGVVTCAAVMLFEQVSIVQAVKHCLEKRKSFHWNKSFQKQLCILAAEHNLLGSKPDGYDDSPMVMKRLPPPPIKAFDRLL